MSYTNAMDQVIPNLWIGDLPSALDVDGLKNRNIRSIVSAMRGRVTLHDVSQMCKSVHNLHDLIIVYQAFNRHQINIDDTDEEDVLVHFLPAIAFIQTELDNKRGVLVHCHAGMSASLIYIYRLVFLHLFICGLKVEAQRLSPRTSCTPFRRITRLLWTLSERHGPALSECSSTVQFPTS